MLNALSMLKTHAQLLFMLTVSADVVALAAAVVASLAVVAAAAAAAVAAVAAVAAAAAASAASAAVAASAVLFCCCCCCSCSPSCFAFVLLSVFAILHFSDADVSTRKKCLSTVLLI